MQLGLTAFVILLLLLLLFMCLCSIRQLQSTETADSELRRACSVLQPVKYRTLTVFIENCSETFETRTLVWSNSRRTGQLNNNV